MKFKEFEEWCNNRACDGMWGMQEALVCISIIDSIGKQPFWRRKKEWERIKKETKICELVKNTNILIEKHKL